MLDGHLGWTSNVIVTAKTSLDLFSLELKRVWTYSVLGDGIYEMKKVIGSGRQGQNQEIIFAVHRSLVNPAPTGNQTKKRTWSVLGSPYHHLL